MRRQLVLLATSMTLLVLLAFLVPMGVLLRTMAADRAVAEATREAQNLAVLVAVADLPQLREAVLLLNQRGSRQVGLVLPDGTTLGPRDPGTQASIDLAKAGRSFTTPVHEGREVYVPVDTPAGRAVVRTFVPEALLNHGVRPAVTMLGLLGVGLLLMAFGIADRLAVRASRPMKRLSGTALALSEGDLAARAQIAGPHEVREVGQALNVLAQRIGELLVAEREAVADLSHRLRTPLTALRLDVEGLREPERAERLSAHLDALERLVDEVILEARRPVREGVAHGCDAAAVVHARATFWSVLMEDQGRPFTVDVEATPGRVRCTQEDLGAALDVLLQNALVHTDEGIAVAVEVRPLPNGGAQVVVADEGPGFPQQVLGRGRSTAGSTGLGLDIARRTSEASGGRLLLAASASGGASTTMVLGPAL